MIVAFYLEMWLRYGLWIVIEAIYFMRIVISALYFMWIRFYRFFIVKHETCIVIERWYTPHPDTIQM